MIVDTRHNGGGWLHDDLATLLSGKEYQRFEPRGQYIGSDPYNKWTKPSCVLMCEDNYSNAHGFPWVYKTLGIGPGSGNHDSRMVGNANRSDLGVRYPASRRERYARQLSGKPTIATGCRGVQYSRGAALRRGHAIKKSGRSDAANCKIAFLGLGNDFSTL